MAEFWSVLTDLGLLWNSFVTYVNDICTTILNIPFLSITIGIFFVGYCIAVFGELLSK